jgi:hypothetical protein
MVLTHRLQVLKKFGLPKDSSLSLEELSKLSKIPKEALQEVYNRGIGAYKSNPQSVRLKDTFKKGVNAPLSMKLSPEQWAMARVYSFVNKSPTTYGKADADIAKKYKY